MRGEGVSYFLPMGSSWAAILRELLKVLSDLWVDKLNLTDEDIAEVERRLALRVRNLYIKVSGISW